MMRGRMDDPSLRYPDLGAMLARELGQVHSAVPDYVSFYFATEGSGKPAKVRTPICLSYHPPSPPTPDEVIARAKHSAARLKPS